MEFIKCTFRAPLSPSNARALVQLPPEDQVPDIHHFLEYILSKYSEKEGFFFEFSPAKQKVQNLKDFLIPIGCIEFEVFNTYRTVVFSELLLEPTDSMWIKGVVDSKKTASHFVWSAIGDRTLRDIPEWIALQIGYPPEVAKRYTGHSFRHSGATWLADSGCSNMQLQKKLNHANPQVISIFFSYSFSKKK